MFRSPRGTILSLVLVLLVAVSASGVVIGADQGFQNFTQIKGLVPGVDFFASNRQAAAPFQKPIAETRERLAALLASDLPSGAIFVCSSLAQKDEVYEPRALKMGYKWTLTVLTPEARTDEMLARMKAQGADIPADRLERLRARSAEMRPAMEAGMARGAARQMAYAMLQVTLAPDKEYRFSRVDDMGRSPLPDWLDIGVASYASGGGSNIRFLQQHVEEIFPLEDVLTMSRPFVAPGSEGGGGAIMFRMDRAPGSGGAPAAGGAPGGDQTGPAGGTRSGGPRSIPKDQQDRMMFDGQAGSFFAYLVEKTGIEKVKQLVALARAGNDTVEFVKRDDVLGADLDKVEEEWTNWVKAQKPEGGDEFRIRTGGTERTERPQ